MGGLRVQRLIATGHSQSAGRLYTYFHSVHPLTSKLYDAVLLHGGGGRVSPGSQREGVQVSRRERRHRSGQRPHRRIRTATGNGKWRGRRISMRSSRARWRRSALRVSGMRPVEGSPAIVGPSISGGEKGNGAAGNGAGAENEGVERWMRAAAVQPRAVVSRAERRVRCDASLARRRRGAAERSADRAQAAAAVVSSAAPAPRRAAVAAGAAWTALGDRARRNRSGARRDPSRRRGRADREEHRRQRRQCRRRDRRRRAQLPADGIRASRSTQLGSPSLYPTHDAYVARVRDATEKNLKAGFITKADAEATIRDAERVEYRPGGAKPVVGRILILTAALSASARTAAR